MKVLWLFPIDRSKRDLRNHVIAVPVGLLGSCSSGRGACEARVRSSRVYPGIEIFFHDEAYSSGSDLP